MMILEDKISLEIFKKLIKEVPGVTIEKNKVTIDEKEIERQLSQIYAKTSPLSYSRREAVIRVDAYTTALKKELAKKEKGM